MKYHNDTLALESEEAPAGTVPLLSKVIHKGKLVCDLPSLNDIKDKAMKEIATLPAKYKNLTTSEKPPLTLSPKLEQLTDSLWTSAR